MLKSIRVSAMLLALAGAARAGEVLTPPAPQSSPAYTAQETSPGGEMLYGVTDDLAEIALDLLAVLPSLL